MCGCTTSYIVSPKYPDHRMQDISILRPVRLLPGEYNFPFVTIRGPAPLNIYSLSGFPFSAMLSHCSAVLQVPAGGPGFVRSVLITLSLQNQLSKKLMSPSVSCYVLHALKIYTRKPLIAETSQYPAGTEYIGMAEHLILNLFNPTVFVLQRFAVLTYMSFNRASFIFHRGYQPVSQVTTVLPVTATPACSG